MLGIICQQSLIMMTAAAIVGLSTVASISVGNELRGMRPKTARFSVVIVVVKFFLICGFLAVGVLLVKKELPVAFISSTVVMCSVFAVTSLLAISVILNANQPILGTGSGIWRAAAVVAYVNLATYYGIGLPIVVVLGWKTRLGTAVIR